MLGGDEQVGGFEAVDARCRHRRGRRTRRHARCRRRHGGEVDQAPGRHTVVLHAEEQETEVPGPLHPPDDLDQRAQAPPHHPLPAGALRVHRQRLLQWRGAELPDQPADRRDQRHRDPRRQRLELQHLRRADAERRRRRRAGQQRRQRPDRHARVRDDARKADAEPQRHVPLRAGERLLRRRRVHLQDDQLLGRELDARHRDHPRAARGGRGRRLHAGRPPARSASTRRACCSATRAAD